MSVKRNIKGSELRLKAIKDAHNDMINGLMLLKIDTDMLDDKYIQDLILSIPKKIREIYCNVQELDMRISAYFPPEKNQE